MQLTAVTAAEHRPRMAQRLVAHAPLGNLARIGLLGANALSAMVYVIWRTTVFNPDHPWFSLMFYGAELLGIGYASMFVVETWRFPSRPLHPPPQDVSVDVFVPTYNEPVALVRRTLFAALRIDYPHETWLLDDGNRPEMRDMATELGCRYLARGNNTDSKAGNLNHALRFARGTFVAVFDADHVADPRFLDQTLGYFHDARVAFVQTPQEFYNFDSYQHIQTQRAHECWSEHSLFYRIVQRGRDRVNAAMMCGCAVVLRRVALDAVGGFATGTVTEDMHTSVRLHAAGWHTVFHPETLSAGLAPGDARSFSRQRLRWAQGAMQVFRKEWRARLTPRQRLAYGMHVINHLEGVRHAFLYFMPAIVLMFGLSPIRASVGEWLAFTLPFLILSGLSFEEFARGQGRLLDQEVFNLGRCSSSLRAIGQLLFPRPLAFWVTPKGQLFRSWSLVPWVVLLGTLAALGVAVWRQLRHPSALPVDSLLILALWASFSVVIAGRLCCLARRCNQNRRREQRFPMTLSATLRSSFDDRDYQVTITSLSTDGVGLRPSAPDQHLPSGPCHVRTALLGQAVAFHIDLVSPRSGGEFGCRLRWPDTAARDEFQYLLLVGRIRQLASFSQLGRPTCLHRLAALGQWLSVRFGDVRPPALSGESRH